MIYLGDIYVNASKPPEDLALKQSPTWLLPVGTLCIHLMSLSGLLWSKLQARSNLPALAGEIVIEKQTCGLYVAPVIPWSALCIKIHR